MGERMSENYERPILSRYTDPLELIWLSTAKRLGMTIRRNPSIFSATDGSGLLELGPRTDLDADDTLAQMVFHEICHWVTNGKETFSERDWGFPLDVALDAREHACLRVQAWWTTPFGLRTLLAPTSTFRDYYNRIPADPLQPMDDTEWEREVVSLATDAVKRTREEPWTGTVDRALEATRQLGVCVSPFLSDYTTEFDGDVLPSMWQQME